MIRPSQLRALQKLAERNLTDPVVILHSVTASDGPYGDDQEVWVEGPDTTVSHVMGWIREVPERVMVEVNGLQAAVHAYRLFVPMGTDIGPNDHVTCRGHTYFVEGTAEERTYTTLMNVTLRRLA